MNKTDSGKTPVKQGPDFDVELALIAKGHGAIAGVDEAGRGPLAGPVVVAAVILHPDRIPMGLNDSKKLSARKRELLFEKIIKCAQICIVSAPPDIIEEKNIRGATLWAMAKSVHGLALNADFALIDGRDLPDGLPCPGRALIGGDARSVSIAAASIVAKVVRDMMCRSMEADCPGYGFGAHKGYGTSQHMSALQTLGVSRHHRIRYAPVARTIAAVTTK